MRSKIRPFHRSYLSNSVLSFLINIKYGYIFSNGSFVKLGVFASDSELKGMVEIVSDATVAAQLLLYLASLPMIFQHVECRVHTLAV